MPDVVLAWWCHWRYVHWYAANACVTTCDTMHSRWWCSWWHWMTYSYILKHAKTMYFVWNKVDRGWCTRQANLLMMSSMIPHLMRVHTDIWLLLPCTCIRHNTRPVSWTRRLDLSWATSRQVKTHSLSRQFETRWINVILWCVAA